ncbi:hypothetical protein [Alteromonas sp. a30]|uniref:hypothetical protein n=1 Tax=Alteromonas sp. a30 TaxID=2730917 RepID=UPI00227F050F|nr:hypothetical protein [Alteromonas sp. a30]MCY7295013.1 hypothetical protein [Alteromonas sp. a30]
MPSYLRLGLICVAFLSVGYFALLSSAKVDAELAHLKKIQLHGMNTSNETLLTANQHYLKGVEQQALDELILLVEVTTLLDIAESSQIGVSFIADYNVTVGQLLKELNQGLKQGIDVTMGSIVAVRVLGLLAQSAHFLSPYLMWLCLIFWTLYALLAMVREKKLIPQRVLINARLITRHTTLLFIVVHLLLPYSIHFSALASEQISSKLQLSSQANLSQLHGSLLSFTAGHKLEERAKSSIHHLKSVGQKHVHQQTERVLSYVLWKITLLALNLILMPGIILTAMFFIAKALLPRPEKVN